MGDHACAPWTSKTETVVQGGDIKEVTVWYCKCGKQC